MVLNCVPFNRTVEFNRFELLILLNAVGDTNPPLTEQEKKLPNATASSMSRRTRLPFKRQ